MGISELQLTPPVEQRSRQSILRNLNGVSVWVQEQAATAEQAGLSAAEIRSFAEIMLRIARVPLLENVEGAEAQPRLHVKLSAVKVVDLYSVSVSVELLEW